MSQQRILMDISSFLEHYRAHPVLWDRKHPKFKCRQSRDAAEAALLPISGLPSVKELRQKIRNIRCTYNQELKKIQRSLSQNTNGAVSSGGESNPSEIYQPKLRWFHLADSFLRNNHVSKFDVENFHQSVENCSGFPFLKQELEEIENNGGFPFLKQEMEERDYEADEGEENPAENVKTQPTNKRRKLLVVEPPILEPAIEEPTDWTEGVENFHTNEFQVFGQHVATQLQQLPLEVALKLEGEIQTVIMKARLSHIQTSSSTLEPSRPSENGTSHYRS